MSVYKDKRSPYYQYDFQLDGHRFHGSTKAKGRREAEQKERDLKREAKEQLRQSQGQKDGPLTIDVAAGRYWSEVGQFHSGSADTWRDLERLVAFFPPTKLLSDITDSDVTGLVAWRRQHTIKGRTKDKAGNPVPTISAATVNRSTTEVLKKLFTRAKTAWKFKFPDEPNWKVHWLEEPVERIRELHGEESDRLDETTRDDYEPFFAFARASGLRLRECLLRWPEVNWEAAQIQKKGKGGKVVTTPITPTIRAILLPLRGHHTEWVFTYVAMRTRDKRVCGQRYPLTYNGVKTTWKRLRKKAGVTSFRFHDFRHDLGSKVLRATGNLKLVQRALNHADIKTTVRYAHVLQDEVATALETFAKSRKKPRIVASKAS